MSAEKPGSKEKSHILVDFDERPSLLSCLRLRAESAEGIMKMQTAKIDVLETAIRHMVENIRDCEECEGTGMKPGTSSWGGDACDYCGGVGKELAPDSIFIALEMKGLLK